MEIVANSNIDSGWSIKDLPLQSVVVTTEPNAVSFGATAGIGC